MLSPGTRRRISSTTAQITGLAKNGAWWGGKGLYVLTASVLMVGVPWAMAFVDEQQIMDMERTERAREVAGEVCVVFLLLLLFLSLFSIPPPTPPTPIFKAFSFSILYGSCMSFLGFGKFCGVL